MDGARLKEVFFTSFLAVQVFFPFAGEGVALLMHNNDKMSRSFITEVGLVYRYFLMTNSFIFV